MTPFTPRQFDAARRAMLSSLHAQYGGEWESKIRRPSDDLTIPAWPFPDYSALWLPGGQRVAFVEVCV
ncbi:hypothetical protein B0W47_00535 [Komagataeibacter nataicola]|uniref:Uncharacterized protein n=1 Tax=Komagataeibacter nataicola TaxID=265960 RepID=A0A9N7GYZ0_9PROT|nr:hypothetical protein [Komagataeibacter nataicola]AQU86189.1 hypothetical protein B0W47_00535 [Komagataeibacter nataicola]PYD65324.1 hypothetical protein CDI09_14040 [Komagataeibacter nataicola]WNM08409.1 hypothetical protein RI056_16350 [Komagataeibacter nataicola]GBR22998.1 hypothetical protein AA0616_2416 [Komagataeibacter nataicola NRIC 0616]